MQTKINFTKIIIDYQSKKLQTLRISVWNLIPVQTTDF